MAKIAAGSMGFAGSLDYALLHPGLKITIEQLTCGSPLRTVLLTRRQPRQKRILPTNVGNDHL